MVNYLLEKSHAGYGTVKKSVCLLQYRYARIPEVKKTLWKNGWFPTQEVFQKNVNMNKYHSSCAAFFACRC